MLSTTLDGEGSLGFASSFPLFKPAPRYSSSISSKSHFFPLFALNNRSTFLHPTWNTYVRDPTRAKTSPLSMTATGTTTESGNAYAEVNNLKVVSGTTQCSYERNSVTEKYDMLKIPSPTSMLVLDFKDVISQNISLISLLTDLDRAVDLVFLAYVGVAGQGIITADLGDRQYELQDLCQECKNTMTIFDTSCESTLRSITDAFESLLAGEEGEATKTLEACKNNSKRMSDKCAELSASFEKLRQDTNADCRETQVAVEKQTVDLREMEDARAQLEATKASQIVTRNKLETSITQLQEDIDAETVRQKVEIQRQFVAQLLKSAWKSIGAGLGENVDDSDSADADKKSSSPEGDEKKKKAEHVDIRLKMVKQKREEERLKTEALATIAKLQVQLKYNETENDIAQSTLTALQIAIVAMDNIVSALNNARFFWDNMTTYCSKLSSDAALTYYEKFRHMPSTARVAVYKSDAFVRRAVGYLIKWKALQGMSKDYGAAATVCYEKSKKNIGTDVTVANAKTLLKDLNSKVEASLNKQKKQTEENERALAVKQKMLETEKAILGRTPSA